MPLSPNRPSRCIQSCTAVVYRTCHERLPSASRRRHVLLTPDRPLSMFISHSPTVGVPWRNFLSPELGQSSRRKYPYFWRYPNFPTTQPSRGKPARKNQLDLCSRFDTIPACDRHSTTADTRARYRCAGKNLFNSISKVLARTDYCKIVTVNFTCDLRLRT